MPFIKICYLSTLCTKIFLTTSIKLEPTDQSEMVSIDRKPMNGPSETSLEGRTDDYSFWDIIRTNLFGFV